MKRELKAYVVLMRVSRDKVTIAQLSAYAYLRRLDSLGNMCLGGLSPRAQLRWSQSPSR